ncbi:GroES-like protein [Acephala macrosclerotiorum]|nr:GroES-like protein [Acephala macrosclerotiorum]
MQAIQLTKGGPAIHISNRPLPTLPPNCLLEKTIAVGLNPHELLNIYPPWSISLPGNLLGCDYASTVVEVGSEVKRPFKKGDRVCGCTRPNPLQPDWGTFAEFIVVAGDVQLRIPEGIGFEDAASLGVTVLTSGAVLCHTLGFPMPPECDVLRRQILVYGGSMPTGRMILEFAKMSNFEIITTCSPNNFEMVKHLGADYVFDYNDPNAASAIKTLTKDNLSLCIDCFSEQSSYDICSQILNRGATYACLRLMDSVRPDLDFKFCMGDAPPGAFESAVRFAEVAERLLADGEIKPHPKVVRTDGLAGVLDGIQQLKEGKVHGVKFVYTLSQ